MELVAAVGPAYAVAGAASVAAAAAPFGCSYSSPVEELAAYPMFNKISQ